MTHAGGITKSGSTTRGRGMPLELFLSVPNEKETRNSYVNQIHQSFKNAKKYIIMSGYFSFFYIIRESH